MAVWQRFWCLLLQSGTAGGRRRSERYPCAYTQPCPLWALEWPLNITRCSVLNAFIQITTSSSITSPSTYCFTYLPLHLLSRLPISLLPRRRRGFGGKALYMCVLTIAMQQSLPWFKVDGEPAGLLEILVLMQQGDYILFSELAPHSETL